MKKVFTLVAVIAFITSGCLPKEEEENGNPTQSLNAGLELPAGSFQVDPDTMQIDNSVTINGGPSGTMPLNTGTQINGQISFNAPNGNVVAGGMRFGDSGPVNMVPVNGALGQTSGTLNLPFTVTSSTCDNLSQVCHDIKCYEFAMTADGMISQSNLRDVALVCGGCDEPSCQDLIDPPCPPQPNTGNFQFDLASGSGSANCQAGFGIVASNGWVLSSQNMPNGSSSVTFSGGAWDGSCASCPGLALSSPNGSSGPFYMTNGSGSWAGGVFYFSGTMTDVDGLISGGGPSYSIEGVINCN